MPKKTRQERRCVYVDPNGSSCPGIAMQDSYGCWWHKDLVNVGTEVQEPSAGLREESDEAPEGGAGVRELGVPDVRVRAGLLSGANEGEGEVRDGEDPARADGGSSEPGGEEKENILVKDLVNDFRETPVRSSASYDWETAPLDEATKKLAVMQSEAERAAGILSRRQQEKQEYVVCGGPGCESRVRPGMGKSRMSYRDPSTGILITHDYCSEACFLRGQEESRRVRMLFA